MDKIPERFNTYIELPGGGHTDGWTEDGNEQELEVVTEDDADDESQGMTTKAEREDYAKFKEEDHPRDDDGKFGSGGGGAAVAERGPRQMQTAEEKKEDYRNNGVKSQSFKDWFGEWEKGEGSKVVDDSGQPSETMEYSKVAGKDGNPVLVYHGTTHQFDAFNNSRGNLENDLGRGFYFTTSLDDAETNYSSEGADLTNRVERRSDELQSEGRLEEEFDELIEKGSLDTHASFSDYAYERAKSEIVGAESSTLTCYLNIRNPVVLGKPLKYVAAGLGKSRLVAAAPVQGETIFELEYIEEDEEGRRQDDPDFDSDTAEFVEETGSGVELLEAIRKVASEYSDRMDMSHAVDEIIGELIGRLALEGISAQAVSQKIKGMDGWYDESEFHGSQFVQDVFREMGFDGAKYHDASDNFENMNITEGTQHWVAFEPNQIKSADNEGTFDPDDDRIRYAKFDESKHPRDDDGKFGEGAGGRPQPELVRNPSDDSPFTDGPSQLFTADERSHHMAEKMLEGHSDWSEVAKNVRHRAATKTQAAKSIAAKLEGNPVWENFAMLFRAQRVEGSFRLGDVSENTTTGEAVALRLITMWGQTSGDTDLLPLALQEAASREFGLRRTSGSYGEARDVDHHKHTVAQARKHKHVEALQLFLRAQYESTQEELRRQGVGPDDTVMVYRGLNFRRLPKSLAGHGIREPFQPVNNFSANPMSSFSVNEDAARVFAEDDRYGVMMRVEVPAKDILGTPSTGYGCIPEGEIVVLSRPNTSAVASVVEHGTENYSRYRMGGEPVVPLNIDEFLHNADWPKRTDDTWEGLTNGEGYDQK